MDKTAAHPQSMNSVDYSVINGAYDALQALAAACNSELPLVFQDHLKHVTFTASSTCTDTVCFPCPLKEQDLGSALKAMEGCLVSMIADLRYGSHESDVVVDVSKVTCFLMSAYLTTLDGMGKSHTKIKYRLPGGSLNSVLTLCSQLKIRHRYGPKPCPIHPLSAPIRKSL